MLSSITFFLISGSFTVSALIRISVFVCCLHFGQATDFVTISDIRSTPVTVSYIFILHYNRSLNFTIPEARPITYETAPNAASVINAEATSFSEKKPGISLIQVSKGKDPSSP